MSDIIRIGVVGLGWVSTHRHIPAMRTNPRYKIVGIADRNEEKATKWGKSLGVHYCRAESLDEIGWINEVDAVDVATSPMSHYAHIRAALMRDKHVITEKPFAMTPLEGQELVALSQERQKKLAIVHNFQFAPAVAHLERDIQTGRIGTIRSILATQLGNPSRRLPEWYDTLPGGLFYDESPHLLYLIRRLSPGSLRLASVDACPSTLGHRTPASIDASYRAVTSDGEIPVSVTCRFESPLSEWHVAVLGDRAAGIVDVFRNIYLRLPNDGEHRAPQVIRTSLTATWSHWWQHFRNGPKHLSGRLLYGNETIFSKFADAISGDDLPVGMAGQDALAVLEMQWAILDKCRDAWDTGNRLQGIS